MDKDSRIRDAQNRVIEVFKKRPQKALNTSHASAVIEDGLTCTFTQGELSAVMDMPVIMGGDARGPTPGFFARAGIAGCVSIGIKQTAVLAGAVFDSVIVDIETDFDDSAMMGLGDATAGPLETRLAIRICSHLPQAEVSALVDKALAMDPWFLALRNEQTVKCHLVMDE